MPEDQATEPVEFNPDANELLFDVGKEPSTMSPQERVAACQHALYEAYRQITTTKATLDYMAELVGVPDAAIKSVGDKAEEDEYRDLGGEEEEYEVADSYADAKAGKTRTIRGAK